MSGFIWNVPQAISDLRFEIGDHEKAEFTLRRIEQRTKQESFSRRVAAPRRMKGRTIPFSGRDL